MTRTDLLKKTTRKQPAPIRVEVVSEWTPATARRFVADMNSWAEEKRQREAAERKAA